MINNNNEKLRKADLNHEDTSNYTMLADFFKNWAHGEGFQVEADVSEIN